MSDPTGLSKTVCLLCRQRKVRCDRKTPQCGYCRRNGIDCEYVRVKKKPGLRAGYVSELERRLAALEQEFREFKSSQTTGPSRLDTGSSSAPSEEAQVSLSASPVTVPVPVPAPAPPRHRHPHAYANAPTSDHALSCSPDAFDPLDPLVLTELTNRWFECYHAWFPILHQPSFLEVLQTSLNLKSTPQFITYKAIAAITIPHWPVTDALSAEQRERWSMNLKKQIRMDALSQLSLQSLQAALILTVSDYGAGNFTECWNMVALCKRMSMQLGLRDLVANQGDNYNKVSTVPPRMLPLPFTLVDREERIRAYWMTEVLDSITTMGVAWNLNLSQPEPAACLPCSDSVWAFPEAIINIWSFGEFEFSSAFSLYILLITNELWHVHRFLQKSFDRRSPTDSIRWQTDCQDVDERLIQWRADFTAAVFRLDPEERPPYDPNVVMSHCAINAATISLYQRLAFPPAGLEDIHEPWFHAIRRCIEACDDMTSIVQQVDDSDLINASPNLVYSIYTAARFYVVHAKHLARPTPPPNTDTLLRALRVCGPRWRLAWRLEKILRTAVSEHRVPTALTSLPPQFYDLQYSVLDIDEALRRWAEGLEPWQPERAGSTLLSGMAGGGSGGFTLDGSPNADVGAGVGLPGVPDLVGGWSAAAGSLVPGVDEFGTPAAVTTGRPGTVVGAGYSANRPVDGLAEEDAGSLSVT